MLRAILNKHPNIAICDETYFFYYVHSRRRAFGDLASADNRRRLVRAYLDTWRVRRLGVDRDVLERRLMDGGTSYPALFAALMSAYAESRSKLRSGEKTPEHAEHVETLFDWFPDATVVHVVRDPRDVVASLRAMPWGRKSPAANARLWVKLVSSADRSGGRHGFIRLHYEELVSDPEASVRSLCRAIDEPFHPELLSSPSQETPDRPWFRRAYRQPINRDRIGIWQRHLSDVQAGIVEWIAGPRMRSYGYEPVMSPPTVLEKSAATAYRVGESVRLRLQRLPASWYHWARPTNLAAEESRIDRRSNRAPDAT